MAQLPTFQTDDQSMQLMQDKWSSQLNPVLSNPLNNTKLLNNITLAAGDNVINHKLGRTMQGWYIVDINTAAVIYRSAPLNNLTLTLNSDVVATINLGVF